ENFNIQSSWPHRSLGLSGRASYSYMHRYCAEFNLGYNGSGRFYKDIPIDFLPSVGLACELRKEAIWNTPVSSSLKIMGSYGLVGKDAIGRQQDRFFYLSSVNLSDGGRGSQFGYDYGYQNNGVSISRYPNLDITWEKSFQSNLALELGLMGKINIV